MKVTITSLKTIWLHLYPGVLILALYVILAPVLSNAGWPSLMSLMISFLVVIIPFEIGHLLRESKKQTGLYSGFRDILINEPVGKKKFVLLVFLGVLVCVLVAGAGQIFDAEVKRSFFSWLPDWYKYDVEFDKYSKNILVITAVMRVAVDGLLIPYAEETYFRGYLLPRIGLNGIAKPVLASILFTVYHFWQPWNYPSLLLISALLVFPAWYFKNYKISLYIHIFVNLIGSLIFLFMVT